MASRPVDQFSEALKRRPLELWRAPHQPGALFMSGVTDDYRVEPCGEWVIGAVTANGMRARSERREFDALSGDICIWDGTAGHEGKGEQNRPWSARLIVLERSASEMIEAALMPRRDGRRVNTRMRRPDQFRDFLSIHRQSKEPDWALCGEAALIDWLYVAVEAIHGGSTPARKREVNSYSREVLLARQMIQDDIRSNISLDVLAQTCGVDKFALARLFRGEVGLPPHRYLIARRVSLARSMLERGMSLSDTAVEAGFFDQSHLNRHFTRRLGLTPRQYQRALVG